MIKLSQSFETLNFIYYKTIKAKKKNDKGRVIQHKNADKYLETHFPQRERMTKFFNIFSSTRFFYPVLDFKFRYITRLFFSEILQSLSELMKGTF